MHKLPFASLLLLLSAITFWSCDNAPDPKTMLQFASGSSYTTDSQTVAAGTIITSSLYSRAMTNTTLKKFRVSYSYDKNAPTLYLDSTFDSKEFGMVFSFGSRGVAGRETWFFTIEDSEKKTYTRQYTLRTTAINLPYNNYSSVFYKKSAFDNLRYFNPDNGTVYPGYFIRNAANKTIQDKVAFYIEPSSLNDTLITINSFNNTTFKITNINNIAEVNTVEKIKTAYANAGPEQSTITNLGASQVIAFKSGAGETGVIGNFTFDKVSNIGTAHSKKTLRQVTYEVRSEK